ncbi:MAG: hypothetical protein HGGPFJEG_00992 [Ignavibacteria bacterium]|nr:hypothetical protein [Ignavibacteria bacterium]
MKTKNIFKNAVILILFALAAFTGCKSNNVTGPNQNQEANFQISQRNGVNNSIEFLFKPSADAKILRVVCRFQEQQFVDTITNNNPNYLFSKDSIYTINEYINVAAGQQWQFDFTGNTPAGNSPYKVTSNYTVQ